ncbi:MAG: peptide chain release factor 2 [Proteobacteria bacterium]|nr:MAG: peptide chain release factor 2 [Pseudomonadota bacterium]
MQEFSWNEQKKNLDAQRAKLLALGRSLDVETKERRLGEIQAFEADPSFWSDNRKASSIQREKASINNVLTEFRTLLTQVDDAGALLELAEEDPSDESIVSEITATMKKLQPKVDEMETRTLLGGENDGRNAFLNINSGAGGTESQDWAQMLLRMYLRWCDRKGFKREIVDVSEGEEAGIKSATVLVSGEFAYGLLRAEVGVHRLVRISPFDSNKRRHTSFSSVYVSPEVDDDIDIEVKETDIRVDVFRSGGSGGQGVNTTDSAVRITHYPSGLVVVCQNERSQIKNRATAMKVLKGRLYERHLEEQRIKQAAVEAGKKAVEWGSQIRSYVLHPYKLVKDHRTGESTSSAEEALDGAIDPFIRTFLLFDKGMIERKGGSEIDED